MRACQCHCCFILPLSKQCLGTCVQPPGAALLAHVLAQQVAVAWHDVVIKGVPQEQDQRFGEVPAFLQEVLCWHAGLNDAPSRPLRCIPVPASRRAWSCVHPRYNLLHVCTPCGACKMLKGSCCLAQPEACCLHERCCGGRRAAVRVGNRAATKVQGLAHQYPGATPNAHDS